MTSAAELLDLAARCLESFPPDAPTAERIFRDCCEQFPTCTEALDRFGDFLIRFGEEDEARKVLVRSIELEPSNGYEKYMLCAQLVPHPHSMALSLKGISLIRQALAAASEEDEKRDLTAHLSSAYCSLAEAYMTELCDEEHAETLCQKYIAKALEVDPTSFEALHFLALFKKTIGELLEAKEAATSALDRLRTLQNREGEMDGAGPEDSEAHPPAVPSMELRTSFVETLVDLMMLPEASEVLTNLLEESEECVTLHHLMAIVLMKSEDFEEAMQHAARAIQLLQSGIESEKGYDKVMVQLVEEIRNRQMKANAARFEEVDDEMGAEVAGIGEDGVGA